MIKNHSVMKGGIVLNNLVIIFECILIGAQLTYINGRKVNGGLWKESRHNSYRVVNLRETSGSVYLWNSETAKKS